MNLDWQAFVAVLVFSSVILLIITEWMHMTVAALSGVMILTLTNIVSLNEAAGYIGQQYETLALFFGVMVIVRIFKPTRVFDYLAFKIVTLSQGQGKKLLLGVSGMTALLSAFLPNAVAVMLIAPLVPSIAQKVKVDFVPLLIAIIFVANSAGLLTLVGDPVTFIISDTIRISFIDYLLLLSPGGIISLIVLLISFPFLFSHFWQTRLADVTSLEKPQIEHKKVFTSGAVIVAFVLFFFIIGESLPTPVSPAVVALAGAVLSLLLSHFNRIDCVNSILEDVDWNTLLFFMCTFVLLGGLEKTRVIYLLLKGVQLMLGENIIIVSMTFLFFTGLLSSVVPNIPLVIIMVMVIKQYGVNIGLAGPEILTPDFHGPFPIEILPLFYATLYGATLGGNATIVGASANIVAVRIAESQGHRIPFNAFLRYGIPVVLMQLISIAFYVLIRFILFIDRH